MYSHAIVIIIAVTLRFSSDKTTSSQTKPIPTRSSSLNFTAEQQDQSKNDYFLIEFQHVFLLTGKSKLSKYVLRTWNISQKLLSVLDMVIQVVEFSSGGYKIGNDFA